ncbi:MAG: Spo0B domain-containing protein [Candidatus Pristimantibacillus lignocellulolyticus]|uniref:Spo0B domain-containing protein n=1 Tax=Candidatus Pristimantibacillus lignocellulolyticus TaxID=2994561 RepID=A0A9J6Z9N1_9BACL|nr:MAG: Spo0B domain-containing protein [Candidatus Pristimantibacillus lignocellulolyticus]
MEYWYIWRRWLWLTAFIPAILIFVWPSHRWINLLALIWVAAIGAIYYYVEQRIHKQQLSLTIRSTHKQWISTMNHHRHDWMNDLQVLFGYIRLGKQERITEYVERIKGKMLAESAISKLEEPSLVSYLIGFRTIPSNFILEVNFLSKEDQRSIIIEDEQVSEIIISIISAYRIYAAVDMTSDPILQLQFENNKDHLNIHFAFNGSVNNQDLWQQKIEQQLNGARSVQIIGALSVDQIDLQITRA